MITLFDPIENSDSIETGHNAKKRRNKKGRHLDGPLSFSFSKVYLNYASFPKLEGSIFQYFDRDFIELSGFEESTNPKSARRVRAPVESMKIISFSFSLGQKVRLVVYELLLW